MDRNEEAGVSFEEEAKQADDGFRTSTRRMRGRITNNRDGRDSTQSSSGHG